MAEKTEIEQDPLMDPEILQGRIKELQEIEIPADLDLAYIWDSITHCNEPPGNEVLQAVLQAPKETTTSAETTAVEGEHAEGKFRVLFDASGAPLRHNTWSAEFKLSIDGNGKSFFVLKSEGDEPPTSDEVLEPEPLEPGSKTMICWFGSRYKCGSSLSAPVSSEAKVKGEIEFNFAEHRKMGESLILKWGNGKPDTDGTIELKLENGVSLNYGEINGYGGDFFGAYDPVCTGKDLDQQCKFFYDAFNTLAKAKSAPEEVKQLRVNRQEEVDAIYKAAREHKSTFAAYKALVRDGKTGILSEEDEKLQWITKWGDDKPSYLRLAQLNLDHFGEDAKTAYKAGHYCALKKAAEGDLVTAYAMNAFADHYLGDCFASGHIRTPRRKLHGDPKAAAAAIAAIAVGVTGVGAAVSVVGIAATLKDIIPDLCVMYMHNEDNHLGLKVKNPRGEEWLAMGDKMLYEKGNEQNEHMMRQSIQASVDEVFNAYTTKQAKTPDAGYKALTFAPSAVIGSNAPLFIPYEEQPTWWQPWKKLWWGVKVRNRIEDPNCWDYTEIGNSASVFKKFMEIRGSAYFKQF